MSLVLQKAVHRYTVYIIIYTSSACAEGLCSDILVQGEAEKIQVFLRYRCFRETEEVQIFEIVVFENFRGVWETSTSKICMKTCTNRAFCGTFSLGGSVGGGSGWVGAFPPTEKFQITEGNLRNSSIIGEICSEEGLMSPKANLKNYGKFKKFLRFPQVSLQNYLSDFAFPSRIKSDY